MTFTHPLARTAIFGSVEWIDDSSNDALVIITTLHLDPGHKKYKASKIERLREAAREYLREAAPEVRQIMLLNPPKI